MILDLIFFSLFFLIFVFMAVASLFISSPLPIFFGGGGKLISILKKTKKTADIICNEDNDFSIFCDTLELAELDHPLRDGGHWTVFAPTDDAFDEFDQTLLEVVLGDTELLSYVLLFHMVQNNILYVDDLECMHTIEMANGRDSRHVCIGRNSGNTNESLYQKGSGNPRNDMPQIIDTDIEACNGVIHIVNRIMLPPL